MPDFKLLKAKQYKVKDGDTLDSIAKANGTTWQQLGKFNWGTDSPDEINKYLRARVGCTKKTQDGKNYQFSSNDNPGIIYIPEKAPEKQLATNSTHVITVKKPNLTSKKPAKAIVKFRPHPAWKGEFGFDWLRCGDTAFKGDTDYKAIVGKYPPKQDPDYTSTGVIVTVPPTQYNNLRLLYKPFQIQNVKDAHNALVTNYASLLNLFPADEGGSDPHEAKLIADIDVKEGTPVELKFDSATPNFADFVEISAALQTATGKQEITVKCKKASAADIELRVLNCTNDGMGKEADYECGRLILGKNNKASRRKLKVAFVSVITNIDGTVKAFSATQGNTEKTFLTKYMRQALIGIETKRVQLDMSKPPSTWKKFLDKIGYSKAVDFNRDWVIEDDGGSKVIANYMGKKQIHEFLEDAFHEQNPDLKDWFKVFFFDERGGYFSNGNYIGLNGGARDIGSKSVALYNTHNTATTTHELLHAIGLYHTFSNSGTYTYTKWKTDNIMDYSHQATPPIERICTWKWQWDILHAKLT